MKPVPFFAHAIFFVFLGAALSAQTPAPSTLQIFSTPSNTTGMIRSYWTDYVQQEVGAQIEIVSPGGTRDNKKKLQILSASNALPDLVALQTHEFEQLVRAGLLRDIGPLLAARGPDILKNAPKAIEYARDAFGGPSRALYGIPANVGQADGQNTLNFGPYIRWDLYRKIGMPPIAGFGDLLSVFKKIQAAEPRNEKGQKTYPLSLWTDWDSEGAFHAEAFAPLFGQDTVQGWYNLPFVAGDLRKRQVTNALNKDGIYIRTLHFYFQAQKMGLLDPDSLTQRWDTALQKMRDGRIFFSIWPWFGQSYDTAERLKSGKGFALLPIQSAAVITRGFSPIGYQYFWGISKNSDKPEKAMQYINLLYNPESILHLSYGPRGKYWDLGADGVVRHTELGLSMMENDSEFPNGGRPSRREGISIVNAFGLTPNTFSSVYKVAAGNDTEWPDVLGRRTNSVIADWQSVTKAKTAAEFLTKNGATVEFPWWISLVDIPPAHITEIAQRISRVVKYNSWQMIYARNEAEFGELRDDMIAKAQELGLSKVVDWGISAYQRAETKAKKYQ